MIGWLTNRRAAMHRRRVFEGIYRRGQWGQAPNGERESGRGSHEPVFVDQYVAAVNEFLASLTSVDRLVDLGCGDFNVGRHFTDPARTFLACDVSGLIIRQNRSRYRALPVRFEQRDIAACSLPAGDVGFLRQVLQHLPNDDIASIVRRINEARPYRWLIVTEHVPTGECWSPNEDMPAGGSTRLRVNSGVELDAPPFGLAYRDSQMLCEVHAPDDGRDAAVRTVAYQL
ncbi:hypothetical protein SPICUR_08455 [Spiribacter curvatus]|uniref:Methyltransferase domain-containing protein n=1 Tax=Spiribacter curvatus TaxID=1335757 RepID=U5T548_9GAMM|nr:class I SAM-dependent methyltransferase [Spiribacter curvatus]AGY92619.1 hypothetical protein SPICUR_08455 [Spiribacter curvatus]